VFAQSGVRFINLVEPLIATIEKDSAFKAKKDAGINPVNIHPNSMATHFYAVSAADVLERDYPQSLGPRSPDVTSAFAVVNDWLPPSVLIRQLSQEKFEIVLTHCDDDLLTMPMRK